MAPLAYLLVYLCLGACYARQLTIHNKETVTQQKQLSSKVVMASVSDKFAAHSTNVMQLDDQKSYSVQEAEKIEGTNVKIPYSWKILQQAPGTEIRKREERSTMESPHSSAEENLSSKKNDAAEDVVVMDYAQPHRKPPIHNKGT